jgi:hypothetical protein
VPAARDRLDADVVDRPRDRADAFHLNVAGYVVKPIRFAAFVELITAICRYWTVVDLP